MGAACAALLAGASAEAETFVGTNVDSRVVVGFDAADAGVAGIMPEGWTPVAFPSGPLAGADMLLVLIDRALQMDAEGKPVSPASSRHVVLASLGKQTDGDVVHLFVHRLYSSDPAPNPYGNSVAAQVDRKQTEEGPADGGRKRADSWRAAPEGGGVLSVSVSRTTGPRGWAPGEATPHSGADPSFSRIYRYSQLAEVAMSAPMGKELAGKFNFSNSVPELNAIFDGSEVLVGILDIPVYVREVYLP